MRQRLHQILFQSINALAANICIFVPQLQIISRRSGPAAVDGGDFTVKSVFNSVFVTDCSLGTSFSAKFDIETVVAVAAIDRESMAEDVSVSGITSNVVDVAIDWCTTLDCAMLLVPRMVVDCCS